MYSSNPPPLNTTFTSVIPPRRSSTSVFEPYALHIISSVIRDLQFLRNQGYISITTLEEIIERLPKPVGHSIPHTPSPSTSPKPLKSPAASVKSINSQKQIPAFVAPQRPFSAPSEISQQQEQQSHPIAQSEPTAEDDQNLQSRHNKPLPIHPPMPLQDPSQSQKDEQSNNDVVSAGQPQLENQSITSKPTVPSRLKVYIPQSNSSSTTSSSTGTSTLATRPLPLPPNAFNSSPSHQPLPVFNSKHEEAEYERSISRQVVNDAMLPVYCTSVVEAMWDFMGGDAGDLSFIKGDVIEVIEYVNGDWWRGRIQRTNQTGIFPKVFTKVIDQSKVNNGYYSQRMHPQHSNSMPVYTSQAMRPCAQQSPPLQQQQLPQRLLSTTQQGYQQQQQQQQHANYPNTRASVSSLSNQQQYYR